MSQVILVRTSMPSLSLDVDPSSNGFVFESDTSTDYSHVGDLFTAVEHFYNNGGTGTLYPPSKYMSPVFDRGSNHAHITAYDITADLNGAEHGAPVASANWTLAAAVAGKAPYPEGVAACISYRSNYGTDVEFAPGARPRARDRNRFYLGPLNAQAFAQETTTNRCILDPTFIADMLGALQVLADSVDPTGVNYNLKVWSRRSAAVKVPVEAWMDNRPDYQRRRSDQAPEFRTYVAIGGA